jgi:hypothetical protein
LTALKEIEQGYVNRSYLLKSTAADNRHKGKR